MITHIQHILVLLCLKYFGLCSFYKRLAIGVLGECYSSDQHKAALLVVRPMKNYAQNERTPLELAVYADDKEFIAHPACQSVLTAVWLGSLRDDTSHFQLKVSTLFFSKMTD